MKKDRKPTTSREFSRWLKTLDRRAEFSRCGPLDQERITPDKVLECWRECERLERREAKGTLRTGAELSQLRDDGLYFDESTQLFMQRLRLNQMLSRLFPSRIRYKQSAPSPGGSLKRQLAK